MPDFFDDRDDHESKWKTKRDYPNKQKKTKGGSLLGFAVAAFVLIAIGWMIVDVFQDYTRYTLLLQEGALTTGVVTEKDVHRTSGLLKGVGKSRYHVVYQYTALMDGSPTQFEIRKPVSSFDYPRFSVGAEIEVLYLPSAPEISEPKIGFGPPSIAGILFLVAVAVGVGYSGLKGILG